jgi:HAD superfamily hydrolase (TIGR01450 family)
MGLIRGAGPTVCHDHAMPTLICDVDGVVWLARRAIPGAPEAIARLRAGGWRILFVTNNSFSPAAEVEGWLADIGVPAPGDVRTSAMAAAQLLSPGERIVALAGPGVRESAVAAGAALVDEGPADAVIVGFHQDFTYDSLRRATSAVLGGARLIGTNDDPTYPTPDGPIPGGGAILAAVATASGAAPTVAGKPNPPMADLVRADLPPGDDPTVVVGDRPSTDGRFARTLGVPFALVLSGVTHAGETFDPAPEMVAADLAALADRLLTPGDGRRVR